MKLSDKAYHKLIRIYLIFLFLALNSVIIFLLFFNSPDIFTGFYRWLQLTFLVFLLLAITRRLNRIISFTFILLVYLIYLNLASFSILTGSKLDYLFLKINYQDFISIFSVYYKILIITVIFSFVNIFLIHKTKKFINNNKIKLVLYVFALWLILFPSVFQKDNLDNELFFFVKSIYAKDDIIDYYQSFYSGLIKNSINNKEDIINDAKTKAAEPYPDYLDNVIILHLESLNSDLVNKQNTPNFLDIAKEGVFFPKFYGNSVQTILAQENLLCSMPSSCYLDLVRSGQDKEIICMPEIFKNLGYKTFFLESGLLNFSGIGDLMHNLKIDEVHGQEIMSENDPKYFWGHREDIFFKRAFSFFKEKKADRNFLYMEVGPTNHWPFETPLGLEDETPYKIPENHQQRLINTTFLQDKYLKIFWEELNKTFPDKNFTLIVSGDHSWPAENHPGNNFNQKLSFEENFLTSMFLVVGNESEYKNKVINTKYSQMDIMPSLLSLFDINYPDNKYTGSFFSELHGKEIEKNKTLLIQPFSNKYLNLVYDDYKIQYSGEDKRLRMFNLKEDPMEERGQFVGKNKEDDVEVIKNILPLNSD